MQEFTTQGMESLGNIHGTGELHYLYLIYPKKNLLVAQDASPQESKYARHKEHDAWGAVQLCSRSVNVWWEEDTLFCSQLIEATYRGLS